MNSKLIEDENLLKDHFLYEVQAHVAHGISTLFTEQTFVIDMIMILFLYKYHLTIICEYAPHCRMLEAEGPNSKLWALLKPT
jgi:hypothetical protein